MNDKAQNMSVLVYNWNPEYKKKDYTNSVLRILILCE